MVIVVRWRGLGSSSKFNFLSLNNTKKMLIAVRGVLQKTEGVDRHELDS